MKQHPGKNGWILACMVTFSLVVMSCSDGDSDPDPADTSAESTTQDAAADPASQPAEANQSIQTIVAIGDSITAGSAGGSGTPYPARVGSILGTTVINRGSPGALSSSAPGAAGNALGSSPSHVMIMFGTNDVFRDVPSGTIGGNIAAAISRVRSGGAIAVVGTLPPNRRSDFQQGLVNSYNGAIRQAASSGGARIANVAGEMGSGEGLILEDGFHPNSSGTQIIAFAFADAVR